MLLIPIHAMGRGLKRRMRHSGSPVSMRLPHGPEVKGQASSRACSGRLRSIQGGGPHGATAGAAAGADKEAELCSDLFPLRLVPKFHCI